MKKFTQLFLILIFGLTLLFNPGEASARGHRGYGHTHVRAYTTKSGRHVRAHMRSHSDHSKLNNWSTKGNVNPYTGKIGTKDPYK
jgi:hypothetical protein